MRQPEFTTRRTRRIAAAIGLAVALACTRGAPVGAADGGANVYPGKFAETGAEGRSRATAGPTLYAWGDYQASLRDRWAGADPAAVRAAVKLALDAAAATATRPAPGLNADYGLLLAEAGDAEGAVAYFAREKEVYPESAVLMEKLIARFAARTPAAAAEGSRP